MKLSLKQYALIVLLIAAPLFVFFLFCTIGSFEQARESGPKGQEIVHGVLHVTETASDPLTGTESLYIVRKTEMYQYYPHEEINDGETETKCKKGWKDTYIEPFSDGWHDYTNPPFPDGLRSGEWVGKAEINQGGIPMSEELIKQFYTSYEETQENMAGIEMSDELLERYQLVQVSPGNYISKDKKEYEVGCVKVTYYMLDPALEGAPVTAAACFTESGELGDPGYRMELYSRDVPNETIISNYQNEMEFWGFITGFLTYKLGILSLDAALILVLFRKRKT